jgi:hypothetical protein
MKFILFLLVASLFACTQSRDKEALYKINHLEFHRKHLDFIIAQKKLIEDELNTLIVALDSASDMEIVHGHWELFLEYAGEFKNKNQVYIEDLIENEKTRVIINKARTINGEISSMILSNKVVIEANLREKINYPKAKKYIENFRNRIPGKIDEMAEKIEQYNEFCLQ